jgi:hypothetical protein
VSIQLTTVSDVKLFIGKGDVTDDALILKIINWVSSEFEQYLKLPLEQGYRTEYFNCDVRNYLIASYPIDKTATITVTMAGTTLKKNTEFFVWEEEGRIELFMSPYYSYPKDLVITYLGGYTTGGDGTLNVPDDLKYACVLQTSFVYKRRKDIGLSSLSLPDGAISTMSPADLLPDVRKILNKYRSNYGMR